MSNPFPFGSPVSPEALCGRRHELRKVAGRIRTGQSSAIVGEPRTGKTSLLNYLMAQNMGETLYGSDSDKLLFCYLDAQTLGQNFSPADFWKYAFEAIEEVGHQSPPLAEAIDLCSAEGYGNFVLERLFIRLHPLGYRLVLLLDEFDALVEHVAFQKAEFYGGLRSLASRCKSLVLVIASRQGLSQLNQRTQHFSRSGSPFSNIMEEFFLGPLSKPECDDLLAAAGNRFHSKDRKNLVQLAGGHPYLLQVAAAALWDAREERGMRQDERWQKVGETLFNQVEGTLSDTWQIWSPEMKKAFTILALDEMPLLLNEKQFDITALLTELANYRPELRDLKRRGFIREDTTLNSGWSIMGVVMLWWLGDEWIRSFRQQDDLSNWLRLQGWDGNFLKVSERQQIITTVKNVSAFFKDGAETFIKAAAEGLGKGISKTL